MTLRSGALSLGAACALVTLPALAAAEEAATPTSTFGFNGISGLLGIVLPEGDLDTTFGLEAHVNLGAPLASTPQLIFLPGISFWSSGFDVPNVDDDFSVSELGILADVAYMFPVGDPDSGVMLHVGGGLGFFRTSVDVPSVEFSGGQFVTTTESASQTDIGFSLVGGVSKPIGEQLDILGQFRLKFGDFDTVNIHGGVQYRFAK